MSLPECFNRSQCREIMISSQVARSIRNINNSLDPFRSGPTLIRISYACNCIPDGPFKFFYRLSFVSQIPEDTYQCYSVGYGRDGASNWFNLSSLAYLLLSLKRFVLTTYTPCTWWCFRLRNRSDIRTSSFLVFDVPVLCDDLSFYLPHSSYMANSLSGSSTLYLYLSTEAGQEPLYN